MFSTVCDEYDSSCASPLLGFFVTLMEKRRYRRVMFPKPTGKTEIREEGKPSSQLDYVESYVFMQDCTCHCLIFTGSAKVASISVPVV